jgi:hypothetical protein
MRHDAHMLPANGRKNMQMSTAIDFDGQAMKPLLCTAALSKPDQAAVDKTIEEQELTCLQSVRKLDYASAALSFVCLLVSLGLWMFSDFQPYVAVQRITWVISQQKNIQDSMVVHAQQLNKYCPDGDIEQRLYKPWNLTSDLLTNNNLRKEVVGSKVAVHVGNWNIWWFLIWIYIWAAGCQYWRARTYNITYKPYLGPDFARWFEYLMTSPFQIIVVCLAFGFSDLNLLLTTACAQAGMMILGYNIEMSIKKIYRSGRPDKPDKPPKHLGWKTQKKVCFWLAWIIHILIWGWPQFGIPASWWGIGGLYQLQKDINQNCECYNQDECEFEVPSFVLFIYYSQFFLFTIFGVVCTWQYVTAKPMDRIAESLAWLKFTRIYALCSITAKTLLEVGFILFATGDMNFETVNLSNFELTWLFALTTGQTNAPKHFENCIANTTTSQLWSSANLLAHEMKVCGH